jgi:hypothetical protein
MLTHMLPCSKFLFFIFYYYYCYYGQPTHRHYLSIIIYKLLADARIPYICFLFFFLSILKCKNSLDLKSYSLSPRDSAVFCFGVGEFCLPHARTGGVLIVARRRVKHTDTIFYVVRQNRLHPRESQYY